MPERPRRQRQQPPSAPKTIYHLIIFQNGHRKDKWGFLDRRVFQEIQDQMDSVVNTPKAQTEIDVWVDSPGGDANAAYKIFLDLQARSSKFRIIIPDFAKSAATLLALGADEIFMAPAAELGPLDAQIPHPDREMSISALDVAHTYDYLSQFAIGAAIQGGGEILETTGFPPSVVLRVTMNFLALFMKPAISKLDPSLVHQAGNVLRVAQDYAKLMLTNRRLAKEDESDEFDPRSFAEHLVTEYPAHGFVISRDVARTKLKLPVRNAENYHRWPIVKAMYRTFCDAYRSIIKVVPDSEMNQAEPGGNS
jgi:hypothetical protein